jgi:hypothetical protein
MVAEKRVTAKELATNPKVTVQEPARISVAARVTASRLASLEATVVRRRFVVRFR